MHSADGIVDAVEPTIGWNDELRTDIVAITDVHVVGVTPMLLNTRILLMSRDTWRHEWVAGWCYPTKLAAYAAVEIYDPARDRSPIGYTKIAQDSRHRLHVCWCGVPSYEPTEDCHAHLNLPAGHRLRSTS